MNAIAVSSEQESVVTPVPPAWNRDRVERVATWVFRVAVLLGLIITNLDRLDRRYVSRDLFLSEMQRLNDRLDLLAAIAPRQTEFIRKPGLVMSNVQHLQEGWDNPAFVAPRLLPWKDVPAVPALDVSLELWFFFGPGHEGEGKETERAPPRAEFF